MKISTRATIAALMLCLACGAQAIGEGTDDAAAATASRLGSEQMAGSVMSQILCSEGTKWLDSNKDDMLQITECPIETVPGLDSDEVGLSDTQAFNIIGGWVMHTHTKIAAATTQAALQSLANATKKTFAALTSSTYHQSALASTTVVKGTLSGNTTSSLYQRHRYLVVTNDLLQMAIRARAKELGFALTF